MREDLHAAVPASQRDHGVDVRPGPGAVQFAGAPLGGSGDVPGPLEDTRVVHRLDAKPPQFRDAGVELSAIALLERARRRDDGDVAAVAQRANFPEPGTRAPRHRHCSISRATA
jgi:hypothetical protein